MGQQNFFCFFGSFPLTGIVLRKAFPGSTRSSVRKDLSLVLKRARASLLSAIKPEAKMRVITQKT